MPLVKCQPCTCFLAKTAEAYAGCLATCSKVKNRCPPADYKPQGLTDQTGLAMEEPGGAELAKLRAARDEFEAAINTRFAGAGVRVRLLVEPASDAFDLPLSRR